MTIDQLVPGYLGPKTKPADFNAFVALCWAVQDHRPDLDDDEIIKRVKTWNGSDFRQNAADILAGPKGMTDEEAEEIERVVQRRTCRVTQQKPEMSRAGFSLVELLVVVSIMLVLATIVIVMYNSSYNSERVRGSARQIQSVILGAKSRTSVRKGVPAGLRFLLDTTDPTVATGFVYVGANKNYVEGSLQVIRPDSDKDGMADDPQTGWQVAGIGTNWYKLYQNGLLVTGSRIRIPENGNWNTVIVDPALLTPTSEVLVLTNGLANPPIYPMPSVPAFDPMSYSLELQPSLLPDEKPVTFASGMVIDLYNSYIPGNWYSQQSIAKAAAVPNGYYEEGPDRTNTAMKVVRQYSNKMDLMFTNNGDVHGPVSAFGKIHLLLADVRDTSLNLPPEAGQHDCTAISLFTRTGAVLVSPVDKVRTLGPDQFAGKAGVDDDGNGIVDKDVNGVPDPLELFYPGSDDLLSDRYYYSETGSAAGK